jgi:hypothetical protein
VSPQINETKVKTHTQHTANLGRSLFVDALHQVIDDDLIGPACNQCNDRTEGEMVSAHGPTSSWCERERQRTMEVAGAAANGLHDVVLHEAQLDLAREQVA